ncbi:MAG: hypothetical protein AB7S26_21395 [Sandaracinaceae bacterium]
MSEGPQTIDVLSGIQLAGASTSVAPVTAETATRYVSELRKRVSDLFPKARVFVRWSPVHATGPDVYTIPSMPEVAERVGEVAAGLRREPDVWCGADG